MHAIVVFIFAFVIGLAFAQTSCYTNADCTGVNTPHTYCQKPNCDVWMGTCAPIPYSCSGATGPSVCGCDGNSYANTCALSQALTNQNFGTCRGSGTGTGAGANTGANTGAASVSGSGTNGNGGGCLVNTDCTSLEYCKHPVGSCNAVGTCTVRPVHCAGQRNAIVCGCDYVSHANACTAALAGYSVVANTECNGPHRAGK